MGTKRARVNVVVPERIDELLTELSQLSGRSKASWVMEAVGRYVPELDRSLQALKWGTPFESKPSAAARRYFGGTAEARAALAHPEGVGKAAMERTVELKSEAMTRQQRREMERAEKKRQRRRERAINGDHTSAPTDRGGFHP